MAVSPVSPESSQFIKDYAYALKFMEGILREGREQIPKELAGLLISSAEDAVAQETALTLAEETPGWGEEPNYHPGALEVHDLEPYMHVVVRSTHEVKNGGIVSHQLILSEPFPKHIPEAGGEVLCVEAKRLIEDEGEHPQLDFNEPVRTVPLSSWGIAPTLDGLYKSDVYVEPYLGPEV